MSVVGFLHHAVLVETLANDKHRRLSAHNAQQGLSRKISYVVAESRGKFDYSINNITSPGKQIT